MDLINEMIEPQRTPLKLLLLDSRQASKLASSKFLWSDMAARLSANFDSSSGSSRAGSKSFAAFLYANGLNAQAITGKSVSEQFKSFEHGHVR